MTSFAVFKNATFTGKLEGYYFACSFQGCNFTNVTIDGQFVNCIFENPIFSNTDATRSLFGNSSIVYKTANQEHWQTAEIMATRGGCEASYHFAAEYFAKIYTPSALDVLADLACEEQYQLTIRPFISDRWSKKHQAVL